MSEDVFSRGATCIWNNARLLQRRLFAYSVVALARMCWPPCSSIETPIAVSVTRWSQIFAAPKASQCQAALEILDTIGFAPTIAATVCDYLQTIATDAGGVPRLLPSAHGYPRAPWWQASEPLVASINPTAAIVGLLHTHGVHHPWLHRATDCWGKSPNSRLRICTTLASHRIA